MRANEVIKLVKSTSAAAFAVNAEGLLIAWDHAVAQHFGLPATAACGHKCSPVEHQRSFSLERNSARGKCRLDLTGAILHNYDEQSGKFPTT